jgi:6,7-dimethyl-8-ribityllumazine synthase
MSGQLELQEHPVSKGVRTVLRITQIWNRHGRTEQI